MQAEEYKMIVVDRQIREELEILEMINESNASSRYKEGSLE